MKFQLIDTDGKTVKASGKAKPIIIYLKDV